MLVFFLIKKKLKLAECLLLLWCFKNIFLKLRILSNKLLVPFDVNVLLNLKLLVQFFCYYYFGLLVWDQKGAE